MKQLRITDDISVTEMPTIKMVCDCGWVEKTFADRSGLNMAVEHIQRKHDVGVIHYHGHFVRVDRNSNSRMNEFREKHFTS